MCDHDRSDHRKAEDSASNINARSPWVDHRWEDGLKAFTSQPHGRSGLHRRMTANRQPLGSEVVLANGRNRRIFFVAPGRGEGRLTEPTGAAQAVPREL